VIEHGVTARGEVWYRYCELLRERFANGWWRVRDPEREPADDEPREPALEAALAADPGDAGAALVYADWYEQRGHPRGALIAIQNARFDNPGDAALADAERTLLRRESARLFGVDRAEKSALGIDLVWERGFVRAARVGGRHPFGATEELVWRLLQHPSLRFLRELVIDRHVDNRLIVDLLMRGSPTPPLRVLEIADLDHTYIDNIQLADAPIGDLAGLGDRYPQLEDVVLKGAGDVTLGKLDLPRARRFALRTSDLRRATLAAIAGARWPELVELEVWTGAADHGCNCTTHDVAGLLTAEFAVRAPKLRVLRVMNSELTDELCWMFATSPVVAALDTLDLSLGTLSDAGARVLADARHSLAHLRELYVYDNAVGFAGLDAMRDAELSVIETPPFLALGFRNVNGTNSQKPTRYVRIR
jgi:uncharacterized protein (TIGR02996 family)